MKSPIVSEKEIKNSSNIQKFKWKYIVSTTPTFAIRFLKICTVDEIFLNASEHLLWQIDSEHGHKVRKYEKAQKVDMERWVLGVIFSFPWGIRGLIASVEFKIEKGT